MKIISLKEFGTSLNTRALADRIFSDLENGSVVVDFDGVELATPSFCHEMLTILLIEKNGRPQIININENVSSQINKAKLAVSTAK